MSAKLTMFMTAVAAVAVLLSGAAPAEAGTVPYAFSVYENASGVNTTSVGNLTMTLVDLGVDATTSKHLGLFKFSNTNTAPVTTKIGTIFFESGLSTYIQNLAFDSTNSSTGVDFSKSAGGSPGGKLDPLWTGAAFDATKKGGPNTIDPGEMGSFGFELKSGASFFDLGHAINHNGVNTSRIVIHVQALPGDESVWAVSVPLPSAVWAGFGLLGALGLLRARRRRKL